jgi:DNA-binding MarR family transcriptional regulator
MGRDKGNMRPRGRYFGEVGRELRRLNRMLRRIAPADAPTAPARLRPPAIDAALVRAILAARRQRERAMGVAIGEAAWTLLLEAYAAHLEGRRIATTGLGAPSGLSRSTAHRWVLWLVERGLLVRRADPRDERVGLIALTDECAGRLRAYLAATLSIAGATP